MKENVDAAIKLFSDEDEIDKTIVREPFEEVKKELKGRYSLGVFKTFVPLTSL